MRMRHKIIEKTNIHFQDLNLYVNDLLSFFI